MLTIVGAVNIDIVATTLAPYRPQDSNPATVDITVGGVAMNYAHNLCSLGEKVRFLTIFADDTLGQMAHHACEQCGLDLSLSVIVPNTRANVFLGINNPAGDLEAAACDAATLEQYLTCDFLQERLPVINASDLVLVDANLSASAIAFLLDHCTATMMLDTVSEAKTQRFVEALHMVQHPRLHTLKVNRNEHIVLQQSQLPLHQFVEHLYVTLGAEGVDYFSSGLSAHHEALVPPTVVSTLGAGDAFLSGLAYCYLRGIAYPKNILLAQRAAIITMAVSGTYNPNLHSLLLS